MLANFQTNPPFCFVLHTTSHTIISSLWLKNDSNLWKQERVSFVEAGKSVFCGSRKERLLWKQERASFVEAGKSVFCGSRKEHLLWKQERVSFVEAGKSVFEATQQIVFGLSVVNVKKNTIKPSLKMKGNNRHCCKFSLKTEKNFEMPRNQRLSNFELTIF